LEVLEIEHGVDDMGHIFVVCASLDYENAEVRRGFGEASCDDTTGCTTWG
jgi:hypothetical protein